MNRYTTRQVTGLTGLARHTVYALIRAGVLSPERDARAHFRFGFRDLVILRTAQALASRSPAPRRLLGLLRALHRQLPPDQPLSALRILIEDDRVLVRDRSTLFAPDSGQTLLDFALDDSRQERMPSEQSRAAARAMPAMCADDYFTRAIEFEEMGRAGEAEQAYRETIDLEPRAARAMINLGRLLHARGELTEAEALYRHALEIEPQQFIAHFNLGIVLEDRGAMEQALQSYRMAAAIDPDVPAIHYNLARLYRLQGDMPAASRHLARFHALRRTPADR